METRIHYGNLFLSSFYLAAKQLTFLILLLAVVLGELLIVASLCAISFAFHTESLCNSATTYAELTALRERVVVKALCC